VNRTLADLPADKSFGELVRTRRLARELTIDQLAGLVGKSKAYLCLVENGKREPTPALIERLAELFGGDLNDWKFLGLEQNRLRQTLDQYPTQVQKFLRTMSPRKPKKR
jgi:HTH-type transcriptional regulator, competence development regulator